MGQGQGPIYDAEAAVESANEGATNDAQPRWVSAAAVRFLFKEQRMKGEDSKGIQRM
jgi:hypothetical protein